MKVLVTAGSRYGATAEIAEAIGRTLTEHGFDVDVARVGSLKQVHGYDAVVVGSAVYAGRWLKPARDFVERNAGTLRTRPVWLFSSGPIGHPPQPEELPVAAELVAQMVEATGAREHRVFAGKLDKQKLNLAERAIATAFRTPEGDYRDWGEIRSWASSIAAALGTPRAKGARGRRGATPRGR